MCLHTREPTVLSRVNCRPSHLNVDRFHQPCLLPGRSHPRTMWQPLTLAGSRVPPSLRLTGGFCHAHQTVPRQDVNSPFSPACATRYHRCLHTQVRDPRGATAACFWHGLGPILRAAKLQWLSEFFPFAAM